MIYKDILYTYINFIFFDLLLMLLMFITFCRNKSVKGNF